MAVIAGMLKEEVREEGEIVFSQGDEADRFFIIYQGKVCITMMLRKEEQELAALISGDYFGEEALISKRERSATVTAVERTYLFSLTRVEFNAILKQFSKLRAAFEVSVASRRLARELRFTWLRPDEVVYFLARKHEVVLFQALSGPFAALSGPIALIV